MFYKKAFPSHHFTQSHLLNLHPKAISVLPSLKNQLIKDTQIVDLLPNKFKEIMKTKGTPKNRLCRIVSIPMKALVKAKDFYVRSMISCSDRVSYGGIGAVHSAPLPRSFSSRSSSSSSYSNESEDFIELVRAASGKGSGNKMDVEFYLRQHQILMMQKNKSTSVGGSRKMPRSSSVAMGKIDEDEPYVFGEDNVVDVNMQMKFPRSRSYAPSNRSVVF